MKKVMSGSDKILLVFYIKTSHLIASISILDKLFSNMSKIHHMKEVMKYLNVFRREFRAVQHVSDEIQTSFFLKISFKLLLNILYLFFKMKDYSC